MRVVAANGSPRAGGRTATALAAVVAALGEHEVEVDSVELAEERPEELGPALPDADGFVLASPVYRASFATPLKALLDSTPRGMWGEERAPLTARPVVILMTGATWHHYLALNDLRNVLGAFFAAFVIPPGLYVPHSGFDGAGELTDEFRELARRQASALVEAATSFEAASAVRNLKPQV